MLRTSAPRSLSFASPLIALRTSEYFDSSVLRMSASPLFLTFFVAGFVTGCGFLATTFWFLLLPGTVTHGLPGAFCSLAATVGVACATPTPV